MNPHVLLPASVLGDKHNLSSEARKEIQSLSGNRPFPFLLQAFGAWAVILGVISLAVYIDHLWMTIFAMFIVATRFNILGLLAHDQTHWLGLRGCYGDLFSNILVAYPIGITVEGYAKVHLSHHRYYFTDEDPDFLRKTGQDWEFPMSYLRLARLFLCDLLGIGFLNILHGKKLQNKDIYNRKYPTPVWVRPVYYVVILSLVLYFNVWQIFLLYWIIPLVTIMPLIVRFGAICEHVYGMSKASVMESSPLIILSWWERILLPNLNFTLHVYHHFYPSISFYHLPQVHKIFQKEGLVDEGKVFYGYFSYLRFLQTPKAINTVMGKQKILAGQ